MRGDTQAANMNPRTLGRLHLAVVVTTALWVVMLIAGAVTAGPVTSLADKVATLEARGTAYYVIYVNAALITLFSMALFAGLYLYCREVSPLWALIGLMMLPLYALLNLTVYLAQILVVPHLVDLYLQPETHNIAQVLLGLMLQDWPGTPMAAFNGLAYALLGIPSVIFGLLLARKTPETRIGSMLLGLSGGLSLVAFVGMAVDHPMLRTLTLVSGLVYLLGILMLGIYFMRGPVAHTL
jgi:hypothetical protein